MLKRRLKIVSWSTDHMLTCSILFALAYTLFFKFDQDLNKIRPIFPCLSGIHLIYLFIQLSALKNCAINAVIIVQFKVETNLLTVECKEESLTLDCKLKDRKYVR